MQRVQEFCSFREISSGTTKKFCSICIPTCGAFHSTKNSEISGPKLNGTVKILGKVFENLGICFECTLFDGISGIIKNFVFHSQEMSGLVSLPSVSSCGHLEKQKWWAEQCINAQHVALCQTICLFLQHQCSNLLPSTSNGMLQL